MGATGLHAANVGDLAPNETSKPWNVSASLRGFYDDNPLVQPSISKPRGSFGIEIKPAASIHYLPTEQTYLSAGYVYSLRWFENRPNHSIDQTHEVTLKADQRFSERYRLTFTDAFVYSQEPTVLEATGAITAPTRNDLSAIHNRAAVNFTSQVTERVSIETGYENNYYHYFESGINSYSALLDRDEHLIHVDGRYHIQPNFLALVGYQFGYMDFLSDEILSPTPSTPFPHTRSLDDNYSHYLYVGGEKALTSQLSVSGRVGGEYTRYLHRKTEAWNPYVDLSGTYTYLPGSYVQFGLRNARNATDIAEARDQETTAVYASVNHRITPMLTGSLLGQYQHSSFSGGTLDGQTDDLILVGLNFEYKFNQNLSAEAGYNFDRLSSDIGGRSYTRNRVYAGVRASY